MRERKKGLAFPGGKQKVFTMSYDDGNDSDIRLVETMRRYGVKGTLNGNFGCCPEQRREYRAHPWTKLTARELAELCGEDMELAVHGYTHPWWDRLTPTAAMVDILDDKRGWESVTGRIIRGAAYPYGTYSKTVTEILRLAGFAYCRTAQSSHKLVMKPMDPLLLSPTAHHNDPELPELAERFAEGEPKGCNRFMLYVWGHSYEFVQENNWDVLESLLQKVSQREDVWYATNLELFSYLEAAAQVRYDLEETVAMNPTAQDVWLCYAEAITKGQEITWEKQFVCIPSGQTVKLPE